jgi:hypothetical protein
MTGIELRCCCWRDANNGFKSPLHDVTSFSNVQEYQFFIFFFKGGFGLFVVNFYVSERIVVATDDAVATDVFGSYGGVVAVHGKIGTDGQDGDVEFGGRSGG